MISRFKIESKLKSKKASESQNKLTSPQQKSYPHPETKKTNFQNKKNLKVNYFWSDIMPIKS